MRRAHLRGHSNISKRYLIHTAAFNLGIVMRSMFGKGTPRGLHGLGSAVVTRVATLAAALAALIHLLAQSAPRTRQILAPPHIPPTIYGRARRGTSSTAC